eukprot:c56659_g1_i1.p1 GENE.c56659_g1_i1~~c56659_g1_i1.p1  ORF type:complete len:159 (+),score=3.22 c56659_g1_i1:32-508(+)
MRTILIAIDNHAEAENAFEYAANNVIRKDSDKVVLLHVRTDPLRETLFVGQAVVLSPDVYENIRQAGEQNEKEIGAHYKTLVEKHGIKTYEIQSVLGDASYEIETAAKKINPDLVVVGSRGLGTVGRTFLGSTSDYLVHHLSVPVLVVKLNTVDEKRK